MSSALDPVLSQIESMSDTIASMSANMESMSQALASATATAVSTPTARAIVNHAMDMGGMGGMNMGGSGGSSSSNSSMSGMHHSSSKMCKMEMTWNWNVINSCFLTDGWHIRTHGQFAGSCIGIFLWSFGLIMLTRIRKEFDAYIFRNYSRKRAREDRQLGGVMRAPSSVEAKADCGNEIRTAVQDDSSVSSSTEYCQNPPPLRQTSSLEYRPNMLEQFVRAVMFGFEYSVTWLLALIIMSFNGYLVVCASLGAFFGFFFLNWEKIRVTYLSPPAAMPQCC